MDKEDQSPRSHLFTIHLWQEEMSQEQSEWRGKVHHVTGGQVRYFRDWQKLIVFLQEMLPTPAPETLSGQEQN
jgi:hypothetical protein